MIGLRSALISILVGGALLWVSDLCGSLATSGTVSTHLDTVGLRTFQKSCARCHSLSSDEGGLGPNLGDLHKRIGDFDSERLAAESVLSSIVEPGASITPGFSNTMPNGFAGQLSNQDLQGLLRVLLRKTISEEVIDKAAAPLRAAGKKDGTALSVVRNQVENGEMLFRTKGECASCHSWHGRPEYSILGPTLFWRGYHKEDILMTAILDPEQDVHTGYRDISCVLNDGRTLTGRLLSWSNEAVELLAKDASGQLVKHTIARSDLDEEIMPSMPPPFASPMPTDYRNVLTPQELSAIVAFLRALN